MVDGFALLDGGAIAEDFVVEDDVGDVGFGHGAAFDGVGVIGEIEGDFV